MRYQAKIKLIFAFQFRNYIIFSLNKQVKKILWVLVLIAALSPIFDLHQVSADIVGERHNFYVDEKYDAFGRTSISATLVAAGKNAYVYIEDLVIERYGGINNPNLLSSVSKIVSEFDNVIYPTETQLWGSEPNPGIDKDPRLTILFQQLSPGTGGYTDIGNIYPDPNSNQREMISIAADTLVSIAAARVYLTHELEHLISANQKILLLNVGENTWLDELRAQYSITAVGYNLPFVGSDLAARERDFIKNPTDSLTEWRGTNIDYAPVTLFGLYLVEHYGQAILQDTLHSALPGIDSINAWLSDHGYSERFIDVFGNWAVANYINQTSTDIRFGYTDLNLSDIRIAPTDVQVLNYPDSTFSFFLKPWQAEWYKFVAPSSVPVGQNLRVSWNVPNISFIYIDNSNNVQAVYNGQIIPTGVTSFMLIPFSHPAGSSDAQSEPSINVLLTLEYTTEPPVPAVIPDGSLIHRQGEQDIYVVEGKYKRYLSPGVITLYGHLDSSKAIELKPERFDSYTSANYIRNVNDKKVYAIWPDGTKHWLNMSAQTFSETGRDWNAIFIINDAEFNFYKIGTDITK